VEDVEGHHEGEAENDGASDLLLDVDLLGLLFGFALGGYLEMAHVSGQGRRQPDC